MSLDAALKTTVKTHQAWHQVYIRYVLFHPVQIMARVKIAHVQLIIGVSRILLLGQDISANHKAPTMINSALRVAVWEVWSHHMYALLGRCAKVLGILGILVSVKTPQPQRLRLRLRLRHV
ncbi:MAG: hypothetical protein EBR02_00440 [Alphaproteobacteria bacterium]|nr:hypothetical protein [Alphaproteobacteria bacterium]